MRTCNMVAIMKMINYPGQERSHQEQEESSDVGTCPNCHHPYAVITVPDPYTILSLVGFFVMLFGVVVSIYNSLSNGLLTIIIGIMINRLFRGTKIISVCPACHNRPIDKKSFAYKLGKYMARY